MASSTTAVAGKSSAVTGKKSGADDGCVSVSSCNQSTKSSEGRRLRQVIQKRQLDVLLQTYSSFLEEPEEAVFPFSNNKEFSLIARKSSIEGNPTFSMAEINEHPRNDFSDSDVDEGKEEESASASEDDEEEERADLEDLRSPTSNSQSLFSEDDDSFHDIEHRQPAVADATRADKMRNVTTSKDTKTNGKESTRKKHTSSSKGKSSSVSNKRNKTKADFAARMSKANEVLKEFSSRALEKQMEVVADFQKASKEIGHQLKSGASVMFEELAEKIDGVIEKAFVVGETTEDRDDNEKGDGIRPRGSPSQALAAKFHQGVIRAREIYHCDMVLDDDHDFQPLSHEETLRAMNRQLSDVLATRMVLLANNVPDVGCAGIADDASTSTQETTGSSMRQLQA